ncbi:hypothetical protein Xph01_36780 [Micromonospora phaseoli]|nr:hypothetical protein Xph01_36780 [Micromonospora phaseoli]
MALAAIPAKRRRATKPPHWWKTRPTPGGRLSVDLRTLIERLRILCTWTLIRQPLGAAGWHEMPQVAASTSPDSPGCRNSRRSQPVARSMDSCAPCLSPSARWGLRRADLDRGILSLDDGRSTD